MSTFGERLHDAMAARDVSVAQVARYCGVSKVTVKLWLNLDEPKLLATHIFALRRLLDVRIHWLGEGKGRLIPRMNEDPGRTIQ